MPATDTALILLLDRLGLGALAEALTPRAMFAHADVLVQAVMLGLLAASVLARAIWAGKLVQLTLAQRRLGRDYRALGARAAWGRACPKGCWRGCRRRPWPRSAPRKGCPMRASRSASRSSLPGSRPAPRGRCNRG